jgi:hypothetical protein
MPDAMLQATVARLRRRFATAAYLGELARHAAIALAAAGIAALLARLFFGWPAARAAACLGLVAPALLSAWLRARRTFLSESTVATWLDVQLGASGRWVTAFELAGAPPAALRDRPPPLPRLRWRALLGPLAPAATFAGLALLLPISPDASGLAPPAISQRQIERLAEKLAALEETVALDEQLRAELHERLERTREQADTAPLSSTYEAMDQLAQRITEEADQAREQIDEARAELGSDALAEALRADPSQAQELVATTLAEMAQDGLAQGLPPELQQALNEDGLVAPNALPIDPAALAKLSKEMLGALDGKLGQLVKSGLIDPSKLRPFQGKVRLHEHSEKCREGGG